MKRSEGLDLMANLLESGWRRGWGDGTVNDKDGWSGRLPTRQRGCCVEAADHLIQMVASGTPYPSFKFLPAPPQGWVSWTAWNDAEGRTQQQVIDYLRDLAATERVKEATSA